MSVQMVFVPSENVTHPETNGTIIYKGVAYTMEEVKEWATRYGVDIVPGNIVMVTLP